MYAMVTDFEQYSTEAQGLFGVPLAFGARVPDRRRLQQAEAPSWGPVTEVWTKKSKTDYDSLQQRFRAADIDGCSPHPHILLSTPKPSPCAWHSMKDLYT